jgi:hypothetical protein
MNTSNESRGDARPSWLIDFAKFVVATVVATAGASWTARGYLEDFNRRLTVVEIRQDTQEKTSAAALDEIRLDLRELRNDLLDGSNRGGKR